MAKRKPHFTVGKNGQKTVEKILKSEEIMNLGRQVAEEHFGNVEESFVGTSRVIIRGQQNE